MGSRTTMGRVMAVALGATLVVTTGCGGASPDAHNASNLSGNDCMQLRALTPDVIPSEPGWLVVDPVTGCVLDDEALDARLRAARVVYVGERHDEPAHHRFQADIVERVLDQQRQDGDGEVLVGFEMFNPGQQPVLDRYSAGELGLLAFLEEVDWASSWGMDAALYEPVLALGPRDGVRLVGLNAERTWSKRVYQVGLDGLAPDERAALPETIDDSNAAYRAWVVEALVAHMPPPLPADDDPEWLAKQQRFFEAQLVWDESMADNLTRAFEAAGDEARAVVVAGSGHVRNRWGIPDRVTRRLSSRNGDGVIADLVIVCEVIDHLEPEDTGSVLDADVADLFCLTRSGAVAATHRPRSEPPRDLTASRTR